MFLTTDVFFFILWSSKYNGPGRIRSQYLDSHFVYILNVIHSQKTTLPVTITSFWNTVYFCLFPTGEELFPGRGSLTFYSSVASYSFYWPSWRSAANSSSATLSRTSFWIFYPVEFNQAKKATLEGSAWTTHSNLSSLSLFSFSELNKAFDTNKYNWWRVLIFW